MATVTAGQLLGRIHSPEEPNNPPLDIVAVRQFSRTVCHRVAFVVKPEELEGGEEAAKSVLALVQPFDGLLGASRSITPTRPGDVVVVVARPVTMAELLEG